MHKSIGYHTRLRGNDSVKCVGGSFGGDIDQETVERISRLFDVRVTKSGTAYFVDKEGRDVRLYFHIDADRTEKGKAALKAWRAEREKSREEYEKKEQEIQDLLNTMSQEEIIQRLTQGEPDDSETA